MRICAAAIGLVGIAMWPLLASAQSASALVMQPASKWAVAYADDSCSLRRTFAAGPDQANLELRQFGPGNNFEVTIASAKISRFRGKVRTRFEPDGELTEPPDAVFLEGGRLRALRYTGSVRPAAPKGTSGARPDWPDNDRDTREQAITALTVTGGFDGNVTLQTGPMNEPMSAMRTCLDDLVKHFGMDPAEQRTLSRKATPIDQMAWARLTQEGLPLTIIQAGGSGRAHLRLMVGPDGKATACAPVRTSGAPTFGKYACDISLRYARFEPALNASGSPVTSIFLTTTAYQISR